MTKKSKRKQLRPEPISSEPGVHPNATLDPDAPLKTTDATWKDRDSTNAPALEDEDEKESFAAGYPALIEKFFHGKLPVRGRTVFILLVFAWFFFVSWLFTQDNAAGTLRTCDGLKWFAVKVGVYSFFLALAFIALAIGLWRRRIARSSPG